jgi:hypothetical protein
MRMHKFRRIREGTCARLNTKTAIGLAIVILLGLATVLIIVSPTLLSKAKFAADSTSKSLSQSGSDTTVRSGGVGTNASLYFAIESVPQDLLVPVGGSEIYTLVIHPGGGVNGSYAASVKAPAGMSFTFDPTVVTLSASTRVGVDMRVGSSGDISPGDYPVFISLQGPQGIANQTFDIQVQKNLLFLRVGSTSSVSLTVRAGETVSWVSRDGVLSDEQENAFHRVIFQNIDLASPSLGLNVRWYHTFTQPGTYQYYDPANYSTGEIVVVA